MVYRSFIIPAGKYWLGDPCYILSRPHWSDFCEKLFNEDEDEEFISGTYETLDNGLKVLALKTAYGDGVYSDQHGNSYPVDAGLIGLIPHEYEINPENPLTEESPLNIVVEFKEETLCFANDGILTFGNYIIDTK